MDTNAEQQHPRPASAGTAATTGTATVSTGYAHGQLARAFATALSHPDAATRERAGERMSDWRAVLAGMRDGRLRVGSRTPVKGLPAWVTPEVLHGGFATGRARAEGPLQPDESAACLAAGIPAGRAELFAHSLTESGLTALWDLLDTGRYRVTVPEEAALLTVAWLVRAGEHDTALELVATLQPFADRLRFTPRPGDAPTAAPDAVHRRTAAQASAALALRGRSRAVETQREAHTVWLPFADELLAHWLETAGTDERTGRTGGVLEHAPGPDWHRRGAALLLRYRTLAAAHTLCGKHRNPRENLGILRTTLELTVSGRQLDARMLGLLRHAAESMVRRRGLPGSAEHTALRREQARQAALPSHHALAGLLLTRLAELPEHEGLADPAAVLAPVTRAEADATGLPVDAVIPASLHKPVLAATSAPVETLIERGLVPSAEVLAELAPQLASVADAAAYSHPALRTLATAGHRAFAGRRSLLLLDYAHQVRADELPWVQAVRPHRSTDPAVADARFAALRHLGELAVGAFPGTILPNPLVSELGALGRHCDTRLPFVEELAADIFMGGFSPKFLAAARIAAEVLEGTLYERYFGIDYAAVYALDEGSPFAALCIRRADRTGSARSVAGNGTVIEQAQILTTHNLATLAGPVGIAPPAGWETLARRAFATACRLTELAERVPRPLPVVKNAAFAWRQGIFHLSLCPPRARDAVLHELAQGHPARLAPAVAGLQLIAAGGRFGPDGAAGRGTARRFLGWSAGPHWLLHR